MKLTSFFFFSRELAKKGPCTNFYTNLCLMSKIFGFESLSRSINFTPEMSFAVALVIFCNPQHSFQRTHALHAIK